MAKKVDPRDFLINTDYEMDKIVFVTEGMIQIDGDAQIIGSGDKREEKNILHGLPFNPLVFGICADNKEMKNAKSMPFNTDFWFPGGGTPVYIDSKVYLGVYTMGPNIVVRYQINSTVTNPKPYYYRIYAFEPTTSNVKIGATKNHAGTFLLDSDHNYRKLFKKGSARAGEQVFIEHNLGYIPQCMFWNELTKAPNTGYVIQTDGDWITVTDKYVSFTVASGGPFDDSITHYRIYCDEA